MLKKIIFVLVLTGAAGNLFSIDMSFIDISSIKDLESLEPELSFAWENRYYLKQFVSDEYWNADFSRSEAVEKLKTLYSKILEIDDKENQEYLLFRALICEYLYHLDEGEFWQKAIDHYLEVENLDSFDYRHKWMLGVFQTLSRDSFEGIKNLREVLDAIPHEHLHPAFWNDYAYSAFIANMPITAIYSWNMYYSITGEDGGENTLFSGLKDNIRTAAQNDMLDSDVAYRMFEFENHEAAISYLFGMRLPAYEECEIVPMSVQNGITMYIITPPGIPAEEAGGQEIRYTILVVASAFEEILSDEQLASFPTVNEIDLIDDPRFTSFEAFNPKQYVHMGGMRTIASFIVSDEPEFPGFDLEDPAHIIIDRQDDSGVYFVPIQDLYQRFPGTIHYMIALDTCEYIFEESKEYYLRFINDLIIE